MKKYILVLGMLEICLLTCMDNKPGQKTVSDFFVIKKEMTFPRFVSSRCQVPREPGGSQSFERSPACITCNYKAKSVLDYNRHVKKTTLHQALTRIATTDRELRIQKAWNRDQRRFICACNKIFPNVLHFENHVCILQENLASFVNSEQSLTCSACNYSNTMASEFQTHCNSRQHQALTKIATTDQERRIQAAWDRDQRKFICTCGKAFSNVFHFETHVCILQENLASFVSSEQSLTCTTCNYSNTMASEFQTHCNTRQHQTLTKMATTDQERRVQAAWDRGKRRFICACNKVFPNAFRFENHRCNESQFLANNTDQSDLGFNEELQDEQNVIGDAQGAMDEHLIQQNGWLDSFYPSITHYEQDLALGTDAAVAALTSLQKTCVICNYTAKDVRQYKQHSRNATHQALTKIATTDQERRIQAAWDREQRKFICACNRAFLYVPHFERHHCSKIRFLANNTDQSDLLGFNEELQAEQDVIRDARGAIDDQIDSTSYQDEQDLALGTDEDLREWLGNMTAYSREKDA